MDVSERDCRCSCAVGATRRTRLKQCRESGLSKKDLPYLPRLSSVGGGQNR